MLTVLTGIDSLKTIRTSRIWRAATVLVLALIWYGIGQSISTSGSDTAVSAVLDSLTLMLYLLVPWTALNLVDFFFVCRGHWDTYFGAAYTHGTPFRRAFEEACLTGPAACTRESAARCTPTPT